MVTPRQNWNIIRTLRVLIRKALILNILCLTVYCNLVSADYEKVRLGMESYVASFDVFENKFTERNKPGLYFRTGLK